MSVSLTPTEQRVLDTCRRVPAHLIKDTPGLNAPLVWSLMSAEKRPSARAVLSHMQALARKGHLTKVSPMLFAIAPESDDG